VRNCRIVDQDLKVDYVGEPGHQHEVLTAVVQQGVRVRAFSEEQTDLEDIFMKVTRGVVS
jgi:ABC-type multidrug transport system ATPase subunit